MTDRASQLGSVAETLKERGSRYGQFLGVGEISQCLKEVMRATPNWQHLAPDQSEALEMIASKIARILNGDQNFVDSWHDVAGYARLVEERLVRDQGAAESSR